MKKYLLMMAAVVLLALPSKATSLEDQLCEDEVFISLVTETVVAIDCMKELSVEAREYYKSTDEFAQLRQKLAEQLAYLNSTYKLRNSDNLQQKILAAANKVLLSKRKGNQGSRVRDHGDCWIIAMNAFSACDSIGDHSAWAACIAAAWLALDICMGMTQA